MVAWANKPGGLSGGQDLPDDEPSRCPADPQGEDRKGDNPESVTPRRGHAESAPSALPRSRCAPADEEHEGKDEE